MIMSQSVGSIVMQPLEALLKGVRTKAKNIFNSVATMASKFAQAENKDNDSEALSEEDDEEEGNGFGQETGLLRKVVMKLSALTSIATKKNPFDEETLRNMHKQDKVMLENYTSIALLSAPKGEETAEQIKEAATKEQNLNNAIENILQEGNISRSRLQNWNFDVLEINERQCQVICTSLFLHERGSEVSDI